MPSKKRITRLRVGDASRTAEPPTRPISKLNRPHLLITLKRPSQLGPKYPHQKTVFSKPLIASLKSKDAVPKVV